MQKFLFREIIDKNYDPNKFADFCSSVKPEGGLDIKVWKFEDLKIVTHKFPEFPLGCQRLLEPAPSNESGGSADHSDTVA